MNRKDQLFHELIRAKLPMLRGGVYRIVRNTQDTDDIIQEALLTAYREFSSLKNESQLAGWVYRIAINAAIDFLKRKQRIQEHEVTMESEKLEAVAASEPDAGQADNILALEQAIQKLPEEVRQVIVVCCLGNLSGSEAADYFECSENTLYQRVHRAKEQLRKLVVMEVENEQ